MADRSAIEWTDATWNPITGCSVVSPGCTNCYAMKLAGTRLRHIPSRIGLTVETKAGPVWNGQVRLNEGWLFQPLRWRQSRRIFVCAHGDLFAESVPDAWIDRVFAVMAGARQHTFQVLTKRSARMREYLTALPDRIRTLDCDSTLDFVRLPLSNVWLGVSAEDQRRADERVPDLLATPAAVRFVSAEPLLGPIDFGRLETRDGGELDALSGRWAVLPITSEGPATLIRTGDLPGLDWLIVGGESGPGSRSMWPDWPRKIRDACSAAGVAFFFKQWGAWAPAFSDGEGFVLQDLPDDAFGARCHARLDTLKVRETMALVGKKAAGRLLDGVEHNGFPAAAQEVNP